MVRRLRRKRPVTIQVDRTLYNKIQDVRKKAFRTNRVSITNIQASSILASNIGRVRINVKPKRRRN